MLAKKGLRPLNWNTVLLPWGRRGGPPVLPNSTTTGPQVLLKAHCKDFSQALLWWLQVPNCKLQLRTQVNQLSLRKIFFSFCNYNIFASFLPSFSSLLTYLYICPSLSNSWPNFIVTCIYIYIPYTYIYIYGICIYMEAILLLHAYIYMNIHICYGTILLLHAYVYIYIYEYTYIYMECIWAKDTSSPVMLSRKPHTHIYLYIFMWLTYTHIHMYVCIHS